ncbi:MAG TPA: SUMF1/EgtB/PvdO family nonheme iron enzyme, partial [Kofleriaceae bacterium]|nr:SUMF1/EgtB/PvdO family nonheme iron enzyme [Kofleriaceae bacterium]
LLASWSTLQDWLQRGAADHAVRARVEQAAAEWERMGRARDLLWGRRQLAEVEALELDSLAPREAAFLDAARSAVRRRRLLGAGGAAMVAVGAVAVSLAVRARARHQLDSLVEDQLLAATIARDAAQQIAEDRDVDRNRAFVLFDARDWPQAEVVWKSVEAKAPDEDLQFRSASTSLENALSLDPNRADLRARFADLLFERLLRAERDHHPELAKELEGRLGNYDDDYHYRAARAAPAHVQLEVVPAGAEVWSEPPDGARRREGQAPLAELPLSPGSVILSFEAPGHVAARLPVLLAPGERRVLRVALPPAPAPRGMIYVPPGRFLFGSADSGSEDASDMRVGFMKTAPLHEVATAGYFIGRYEVTFAEWIEFLDDLAPNERRRRTPNGASTPSSVALVELGPKRWRLEMMPTKNWMYTAETGQRLRYEGRAKRAEQDWTKFPVTGVSYEDAVAYAVWLDRTGRVPGARLCDEHEWERAARGADGRIFPSGKPLETDDANIDVTYGQNDLAFGPDEVGSHPASRSPVGADDMAGNAWEWTRSVAKPEQQTIMRGGCSFTSALNARSMNRELVGPTTRHPQIGVRLCATPR